jgi:hypothetical protein
MRAGIYYLNNRGDRWEIFDENGEKPRIDFATASGAVITRTAIRYEQWGNFALVVISYKGKQRRVFLDEVLED